MKNRQKEIIGLLLIVFSITTIYSLFGHNVYENPNNISREFKINNPLGNYGVYLSYYHFVLLGYPSIVFPLIIGVIGYILFTNKAFKN